MTSSIRNVLVLGAGKVGSTIADMISQGYGLNVTLSDIRHDATVIDLPRITRQTLDVADASALARAIASHDAVINALPYFLATLVATQAAQAGRPYFDLTEDVAATQAIRALGHSASAILMPQSGLAPGVIGMLGAELARAFDTLYDLQLRVGALTRESTNRLRYNFTWSVDGVINEYCHPCEAIVNGVLTQVQPLEGYGTFALK